MKNVLLLTTTPTVGGNGDALIAAAFAAAKEAGAELRHIAVRDKKINFCHACYGCAETGVCVQQDDFREILLAIHESDGIIAEAPIYYNCIAAQAMEQNRALLELIRDTARTHSATPAQISLAWMLCKSSRLVPIPGTRKPDRLRENLGAADVKLTTNEVTAIDRALDGMEMSQVFGGSPMVNK